jgi:hypothetical protein
MFSVFSFVKFLSCMDNATSYQTACCGVMDHERLDSFAPMADIAVVLPVFTYGQN